VLVDVLDLISDHPPLVRGALLTPDVKGEIHYL
jgi:hypothetical protein